MVTNVVVAVVTSPKRQTEYASAIRATWGASFKKLYIFSHKTGDYIDEVVPTRTDYIRSTWEELNALRVLYNKHPHSPWYFKCDDDAWVHGPRLSALLSKYDHTEKWYLGEPYTFMRADNTTLSFCLGGTGYAISNALMQLINSSLLEDSPSRISDVQVGELTLRHSITCTKLVGSFARSLSEYIPQQLTPDMYKHINVELHTPVSFHYMTPESMHIAELMYRVFFSNEHCGVPV